MLEFRPILTSKSTIVIVPMPIGFFHGSFTFLTCHHLHPNNTVPGIRFLELVIHGLDVLKRDERKVISNIDLFVLCCTLRWLALLAFRLVSGMRRRCGRSCSDVIRRSGRSCSDVLCTVIVALGVMHRIRLSGRSCTVIVALGVMHRIRQSGRSSTIVSLGVIVRSGRVLYDHAVAVVARFATGSTRAAIGSAATAHYTCHHVMSSLVSIIFNTCVQNITSLLAPLALDGHHE